MDAIQTEGLTRLYGSLTAVDGVTLTVERGEVFGVLGPNGAGKTTMVRLLNGVLAPSLGKCHVLGLDPKTQGSEVRRRTGVLTESPALYDRVAVLNRGRLIATGTLSELARTLWHGTWVDIECLALLTPSLSDALRGMPGVTDAHLDGTRLAVQVEGEEVIPAVVRAVVERGGQVLRVGPAGQKLEDDYFGLQG